MPLDQTINEVPQAQTEGIARRLMGDDLVNRYGDVIGARQTTAADVLRDFTIGFSHGREKVDQLHTQMQGKFRDEYNKAADRAITDKKLDIEKTTSAWEAIKWAAEKAPRGYATKMLKERLTALGFDPESLSPTAMKMLSDADFVAQLPKEKLDGAIANGQVDSTMLGAYASNPENLDRLRSEAVDRTHREVQTGELVLNAEHKALKAKQDRARFQDWRTRRPLSIANARLRNENLGLQNQKLKNDAGGGILEQILSGKGLGMTPTPVEPTAQTQPVAGADVPSPLKPAPTADAVDAAKARLGLK